MILRRFAVWGFVGLFLSLAFALPRAVAGSDAWIGREVMPKATCAPKIEDRDIPLKLLSLPLKVSKVNGEWLWLGRAWVKKRDVVDLEQAGTYYTEYLRKNPQSSWAHTCRGAVFARRGEADAARLDFDTAVRLDPSNLTADPTNVLEKFCFASNGDWPTIPVTIGGHEYQFVVDTGCSWCVVDDTLKSHLVSTGKTARVNHRQSFDVYELPDASIGASRLKVGGIAVCADLAEFRKWTGHDIRGLIGMSFLKAYVLHIDFDAGMLAILKRAPDSTSGAIDISFPSWGDLPTIDIKLPTHDTVRFQIDSGMAAYSQFDVKTFASLVDDGHTVVVDDSGGFQTIHGKEQKRTGIVTSLPVGQFVPENIECSEGSSNVLGLNVLSRFVVTFDFPNDRLYLQKGKRFCRKPRFDMSGMALSRIGRTTTVEWVSENSPAIEGGLKDGDQLMCFNGKPSHQFSLSELKERLSEDGRCVQVVVRRNSELHHAALRLSDWQKMAAKVQALGRVGATVGTHRVVTAEHRGAKGRSEGEQPTFSDADETSTNENSILEAVAREAKSRERQVAATVNGKPIFVDDILRQIPIEQADALANIERWSPPEKFREIRRLFIKRHLQRHIEQELLLQELKSALKEPQLKSIEQQLDAVFNKEKLPQVMKEAGVESEAELEAALRKRGFSIEYLRSQFRNGELAQQYLGSKCVAKTGFDPPDVLKYYQEHKDDYAIPAQTKWEEIRLEFSKHGGKSGAMEEGAKILERLKSGEDFATIAQECSDGPTAESKRGMRGWIAAGTLKEKELERALHEQPVGEVGPLIETEAFVEIVRVIDRTPSVYKPLSMIQDDVKTHLKNTLWQQSTSALIEQLREQATIETFIDEL